MALSWSDLEGKFKALEDDLPFTRVEASWHGPGQERWQLAGPFDPVPARRFETVARVAGNKLKAEPGSQSDIPHEVRREPDPVIRWYKAVWKMTESFRYDFNDPIYDEHGKPAGHRAKGTIKEIVSTSANLCSLLDQEYGGGETTPQATSQPSGLGATLKSLLAKKR